VASRAIVVEFLGKDSVSPTAKRVEQSFGKLGGTMDRVGQAAGKVLAVGLVAAGAAAYKATQAAAADSQAQALLANQLREGANATDTQIASTEAWVTAQGKAFGVADNELRPALSKLATATGSVSKAQELASLAMDVSAGSGKSLSAVTQALVMAQNGSLGGLSRMGIATKNAAGETKSLAQVTDELTKKYQGAAATSADTVAGKQKILAVQFSELQEQIGAKLLPVMNDLATVGLKVVDWISRNTTTVGVSAFLSVRSVGSLRSCGRSLRRCVPIC
jgi:hypothetical protein